MQMQLYKLRQMLIVVTSMHGGVARQSSTSCVQLDLSKGGARILYSKRGVVTAIGYSCGESMTDPVDKQGIVKVPVVALHNALKDLGVTRATLDIKVTPSSLVLSVGDKAVIVRRADAQREPAKLNATIIPFPHKKA